MYRNPLLPPKEEVRVIRFRKARYYSGPALPQIARRFSGLASALLILLAWVNPVLADPADDLARAKISFDQLQSTIIVKVGAIDPELRAAAWGQYYLALEQLQRMDAHQQMMTRHKQYRRAEFARALAQFGGALDELDRILAPSVKMDAE